MNSESRRWPRKAAAITHRKGKGRPSQGGCHAAVAWRPTCRAGGDGTTWTRYGPSSKARGKARGGPSNETDPSSPPDATDGRQPSDLTDAVEEFIMPTSSQRTIRLADHRQLSNSR
jgi:hypothetical protein